MNNKNRDDNLFLDFGTLKPQMSDPENELAADLLKLQESLRGAANIKMTDRESRLFMNNLEIRLGRYHRRAISFYRYSYRLAAVTAALFLVITTATLTLFDLPTDAEQTAAVTTEVDDNDSATAADSLDEAYVYLLVSDYVHSQGYGSGEALLGELEDEELSYLEKNLKFGDSR